MSWWNSKNDGWQGVLGQPLPAPGVARLPTPLIEKRGADFYFHYDILGLTYWMLARVEEMGRTDLDIHERFPAKSSHAFKNGYLDRPAVDEWLHMLGTVLQRQWPRIEIKQHQFEMSVSHDVDRPSLYAFENWKSIGKIVMGHLLKRRNLKAIFKTLYIKVATREQLLDADPFNTFDWLMDVSELNGIKSVFFFNCGRTSPKNDPEYQINNRIIRNLIKKIKSRGHEIGLHPSYGTHLSSNLISIEFEKLKTVCQEMGIRQNEWGCRMHYLRWSHPKTMQALENTGINYDCTMGFPDSPGFRCGTSQSYQAFDPENQRIMNLKIQPLILMDSTIYGTEYLNLKSFNSIKKVATALKTKCRLLNGSFTTNWHNCEFRTQEKKRIFTEIIGK